MSPVSGSSDANNAKKFEADPMQKHSEPPKEVDLTGLGTKIHKLESTAAENSKIHFQETLKNMHETNKTQNSTNQEVTIKIATDAQTQQGVIAALAKAGYSADQFLSAFQGDSAGSITQMANVINKYMSFVPNQKDLNSPYILANVLFKTLGQPINKPTNVTWGNNQTEDSMRVRAETDPIYADDNNCGGAYRTYNSQMGNPINQAIDQGDSHEQVCSSTAIGNLLLQPPTLFPDPSSIKADGKNPVALPLTDSQNDEIHRIHGAIKTIDATVEEAKNLIHNSLEQLNDGDLSTAAQSNLASVQEMASELSPQNVTADQLQNLSHILASVISGHF
jgi:hypothetical protein